jgi:hypothetical protein
VTRHDELRWTGEHEKSASDAVRVFEPCVHSEPCLRSSILPQLTGAARGVPRSPGARSSPGNQVERGGTTGATLVRNEWRYSVMW